MKKKRTTQRMQAKHKIGCLFKNFKEFRRCDDAIVIWYSIESLAASSIKAT
jgi:hypothetical protein